LAGRSPPPRSRPEGSGGSAILSLAPADLPQYQSWFAAFRDGLRELGYVEGENLVIEQGYAAGQLASVACSS
jgi:hypothetical protein